MMYNAYITSRHRYRGRALVALEKHNVVRVSHSACRTTATPMPPLCRACHKKKRGGCMLLACLCAAPMVHMAASKILRGLAQKLLHQSTPALSMHEVETGPSAAVTFRTYSPQAPRPEAPSLPRQDAEQGQRHHNRCKARVPRKRQRACRKRLLHIGGRAHPGGRLGRGGAQHRRLLPQLALRPARDEHLQARHARLYAIGRGASTGACIFRSQHWGGCRLHLQAHWLSSTHSPAFLPVPARQCLV